MCMYVCACRAERSAKPSERTASIGDDDNDVDDAGATERNVKIQHFNAAVEAPVRIGIT